MQRTGPSCLGVLSVFSRMSRAKIAATLPAGDQASRDLPQRQFDTIQIATSHGEAIMFDLE